MVRQITRLPHTVISHLRSSTILSNVAQIAEELVCNSLDADAKQIEVAVDAEGCYVKVDDDGRGISRDDLSLVGERHATSKLHSLEELEQGVTTFGFRGEALSSLSDIALVEITSRCRGTPSAYRKIVKSCTTVSIGLCGDQRKYGTSVIVRDIFYNQPVRRKLLKVSDSKITQSVKECVIHFVLIHPHVSFTVRDLARNDIILHTKRAENLRSVLCEVFGEDLSSRLQESHLTQGHLRLTGFVSTQYYSHPSKAVQYLYINRRHVVKTSIHKLLNSSAMLKSYCNPQNYLDTKGKTHTAADVGRKELSTGKCQFPMFVLNLTCPFSDYDITFEPSKTLVEFKNWKPVISFVKTTIQRIWGNQSSGKKQDSSHPPQSPQGTLAKASPGRNFHQHTNSRHQTWYTEDIPSVAVGRGVLGCHSRPFANSRGNFGLKKKDTVVSDNIPEHKRAVSECFILPANQLGKECRLKAPNVEMHLKEKQNISREMECITNSDSDTNAKHLLHTWLMSPCRQQNTTNQPEVSMGQKLDGSPVPTLGSEWFQQNKDFLSPKSKEQLTHSIGKVFQPLSSNVGKTSNNPEITLGQTKDPSPLTIFGSDWLSQYTEYLSSDLEDQHPHSIGKVFKPSSCNVGKSAFKGDYNHTRGSPVIEKTWLDSSSPERKIHQSPNPGIMERSRTPGLHVIISSDDESGWLCPFEEADENLVQRSQIRGSVDILQIKDTSEFFPEVNSFSPEGASRNWEWECPRSGSDIFEGEISWALATQTQCKRSKYVTEPDSSRLDDYFLSKSNCFSPEPYQLLVSTQRKNPDLENWEMASRCSEGIGSGFGQCSGSVFVEAEDDTHSIRVNEQHLGTYQHHSNFTEVNSHNLQAEKSVSLTFEDRSGNMQSVTDNLRGQNCSKQGEAQHASPPQATDPGRRCSGPPFYRPPKRHGVHMNPPNSLSTLGMPTGQAEHCRVLQQGTDPKVLSQVPQSKKVKFKETLEEATQTEQPEVPLVVQKNLQTTQEMDPCHDSKYRSAVITRIGVKESELPADTLKVMLKEWSNPCMKKDDDILDVSSGVLTSNNRSLLPGSVTKDIFKDIHVLQQVDTKFIPSVARGVLVLFDQHAVDERVRLEEFRKDVLGAKKVKEISPLSPTQELTIAFVEEQMLHLYFTQIENWGWRIEMPANKMLATIRRPGFSTGGVCKVFLHAVPCILGVRLTAADLTEYLRQLVDTEGSSAPPPAVIRVLNNKACRGAIMFGDKLLPAECNQLIEHLKKTQLCFQCAHGRPTMVPLVDLRLLHKRFHLSGSGRESANIDSSAHAASANWHGLQTDVAPNLERARERLWKAQGV